MNSLMRENRVFRPSSAFSKTAAVKSFAQYQSLYREAMRAPEKFWASVASELVWFKKGTKVLHWKLPCAKWYVGGKIMRRLPREIASTGSASGDTTTLQNLSVLEKLRAEEEE